MFETKDSIPFIFFRPSASGESGDAGVIGSGGVSNAGGQRFCIGQGTQIYSPPCDVADFPFFVAGSGAGSARSAQNHETNSSPRVGFGCKQLSGFFVFPE